MPQGKPLPGELYRHFKNKMYQIVAVATHSETREPMVVYQALYDDFMTYVRPYDMFISEVDHEKYPHVFQKYRFELVGTVNVTERELSGVRTEDSGAAVPAERAAENEPDGFAAAPADARREKAKMPGVFGGEEEPRQQSPEDDLSGVDPRLLAFLDTDDFEEKYKILCTMEGDITDHLIDQFAVTLDVVIPEGDVDDRFQQLKTCVRTRSKFESNRLR